MHIELWRDKDQTRQGEPIWVVLCQDGLVKKTLYRDRTLRSVIEADKNAEALRLFYARLDGAEWALYRVRRLITRKGAGDRSVQKVATGSRMTIYRSLLAHAVKADVSVEVAGNVPRAFLSRRQAGVFPTSEEFFVASPALADDKQRPSFEVGWRIFHS